MPRTIRKYNLRKKKTEPPPSSSDSSSEEENSSTEYMEEDDNDNCQGSDNEEYEPSSEEISDDQNSPKHKHFQKLLERLKQSGKSNKSDATWVSAKSPTKKDASRKTDDISERQSNKRKSNSKANSPKNKRKGKVEDEYSAEDSESEFRSSSSGDEDYDTEDSDNQTETHPPKKSKFNIIVNIGDNADDEYESDDSSLLEDENEECNSEDEETFMKGTYEKVDEPDGVKPVAKSIVEQAKKPAAEPKQNIETEYKDLLDWKKVLVQQIKKTPKNKLLVKNLKECDESIRALVRKARHENTNKYYKLINTDTQQTDEVEYFKRKLSNAEQLRVMNDLKEINAHIYVDKPYRLTILQSAMDTKFKAIAMQKLNMLLTMETTDNEYHKLKHWVDAFMRIPFGIYRNLNISMDDGVEKCNEFMVSAKSTLDRCVFGLDDTKLQIMQMVGQWMVNPASIGTAIAIHGPPGTGKTSIVKDGISKILGREFAFIALGGCGDSSFLDGHSYTYEGSLWGKIVQILMDSKCMNPVIYFDELDKVSDSARGQEIIGILTHLTDTSQNTEFHDKYFSEVSFDLSKCLFIFSYNDEHLVNPILRDRMYRIHTKEYSAKEKITIARDYILPKIREQVKFAEGDIIIPDDTLQYIINADHITQHEKGVRNLKRCLEIIHTKLNLFRLVSPETNMFQKDIDLKVTFPFTVTRKEVDVFVKRNETINQTLISMYV